jgi:low affinity Fe/Cu permease
MKSSKGFSNLARMVADFTGRTTAFTLALSTIILWLITGPIFAFSDTWQLVINTGTTIVTFLMVFLIQNTQNRDSEAVQIKLDELIRAHEGAHNALLDLEDLTPEQLRAIRDKYFVLAEKAREAVIRGESDTKPTEP